MEVRLKPLFAGGEASISIPEGITILGRNNTGIKDKTCSREQVHIRRKDNLIDLVVVGTNPSSLISDAGEQLGDPWKILKGKTMRLHHGSIFGLVGFKYEFELEVLGGEEEIEIPFNKKRKLPQPSPVPSSSPSEDRLSKALQNTTTPSLREGGESDDTQHVKKRRVSHSEENTAEESEVVDLIRRPPENGEEESEGTKKKKKRILIEDDDEQESERFYADFEAALGKSVAAEGKGKGKAKANASENRNEKEKEKEKAKGNGKEKGKEKMTEKKKKEMEALKRFEMEEDSMYDEDEALARRLQQEEDQSEGSSSSSNRSEMSEREKADAALARKLFEEETKHTRARKDAEKKDQEIARKLQEQENNKKKARKKRMAGDDYEDDYNTGPCEEARRSNRYTKRKAMKQIKEIAHGRSVPLIEDDSDFEMSSEEEGSDQDWSEQTEEKRLLKQGVRPEQAINVDDDDVVDVDDVDDEYDLT